MLCGWQASDLLILQDWDSSPSLASGWRQSELKQPPVPVLPGGGGISEPFPGPKSFMIDSFYLLRKAICILIVQRDSSTDWGSD